MLNKFFSYLGHLFYLPGSGLSDPILSGSARKFFLRPSVETWIFRSFISSVCRDGEETDSCTELDYFDHTGRRAGKLM
jgi:hypothetical protein